MTGKALKLILVVISMVYLHLAVIAPIYAQDKTSSDITYGESEETDFC